MNKKLIIFTFGLLMIFILSACSSTPKIDEPMKENTLCGDGICQSSENNSNCPYDCQEECKSDYCNEKIWVYCGYSNPQLSKQVNPLENVEEHSNCSKQEKLFSEFFNLQSKVYNCLASYFNFKPMRINYVIYYPKESICQQKDGCEGAEGGRTTPTLISMSTLPGKHPFGENQPINPSDLIADKHETTHYFLFKMLGNQIPDWFNEAIAIQTNERVHCEISEYWQGDAYLIENEGESYQYGIKMNDKTYLNYDFYTRLKDKQTNLSSTEKKSPHIIGALFIMGLNQDYNCSKECITKVVLKLHENRKGIENITSLKIKQAIEEVTKRKVQPLFDLLEIKLE
ncbi:MAG: hypothetical protein WCV90_05135 [Candidatus Woesearchaeota archaeon]